jgi:hypothetical protein
VAHVLDPDPPAIFVDDEQDAPVTLSYPEDAR